MKKERKKGENYVKFDKWNRKLKDLKDETLRKKRDKMFENSMFAQLWNVQCTFQMSLMNSLNTPKKKLLIFK